MPRLIQPYLLLEGGLLIDPPKKSIKLSKILEQSTQDLCLRKPVGHFKWLEDFLMALDIRDRVPVRQIPCGDSRRALNVMEVQVLDHRE